MLISDRQVSQFYGWLYAVRHLHAKLGEATGRLNDSEPLGATGLLGTNGALKLTELLRATGLLEATEHLEITGLLEYRVAETTGLLGCAGILYRTA